MVHTVLPPLGLSLMNPLNLPGAPAMAVCARLGTNFRHGAVGLLAIWMIAGTVHATPGFAGKVSHVSDGDTLWVQPDGGGAPRKIRLDGVDAPELCQPGGVASRQALERAALNRRAEVRVRRHDDYGRELARVQVDHQDLGAQLVREGQAWSYRWRRHPGPYAAEEAQARQARRGLFAAASPERPRDFRQRHGPCPAPGH